LLEAHLDMKGMPVIFVDTAGLRESRDEIEKIGVARTLERARRADLLLWLSEGGRTAPPANIAGEGAEVLQVATKSDIEPSASDRLAISARTGKGLDALFDAIFERAKERLGDGASSFLLRDRQRRSVEQAAGLIEQALCVKPLEIRAEQLHGAGRALASLVGAVDVEHVLDAIFAQFCVGK
jgi:tRNA modification GTPase